VFPASFAQQRLWLLDRLLPVGSVYNVPRVFRLRGDLAVEALRGAFDDLLERHESLRTRFGLEESGPVQLIAAQQRVALEVEDLTGLQAAEREEEARRRAQAEAQTPFDLERGPLLRVRLLRIAEREHWLLLTLHHIITDGWSSGVMVRELSELYGARLQRESANLPGLAVQYADYAVWQREWLQGEVLEQQLAYWKPALAGLAVLELPADRPRPAVASFRGGRTSFAVDAELTQRLKDLGRAERATLFMTLLAAFQVLLHRYSGQEDIAVGAPIAGRVRPELGGLIGFFVNTLVLRGDLSGDPSFSDYLGRVRARALEAYAHQDLPFEKLVEELHPKRDLSRNPLFQVALALQNAPSGELRLDGLEVDALVDREFANESAKFDLQFSVTEVAGELRTRVEYALDLFDASRIERMVGHWRVLLEGIVADPARPISRLPLLTQAERTQLGAGWNATAADYPRDCCAHELFERQVARTPQAVAVAFGERSLSYAELNARANRLAHYLRTQAVGPETLVGLCIERSLELVVGLLGIWKAGAVYVPLDPGYPQKRLEWMLEDTQAAVVLTSAEVAARLPVGASRRLCLDSEAEKWVGQSAINPAPLASARNLAYVIYTSGSTGTPRGVMVEHASLVNFLVWAQRQFSIAADDHVLHGSPTSFDISLLELALPLIAGARLELAPPHAHRSPADLVDCARRCGTTVMQLVPSTLRAIADGPGFKEVRSLRLLLSIGEPLGAELARDFHRQSGAVLVNNYGPTETTVYSTFWVCDRNDERPTLPIGRPLANTRILIRDPYGELVPIGISGEIFIGGRGVARGYRGQPELGAERFVPDPDSGEAGARLYATGDFGRYRGDGSIEFLGRRDYQVKIRGFRIELGEIESVLAHNGDVASAVVTVREDRPGDKRLVAYIVARPGATLSARALRESAAAILPAYMIPSAFVMLDRYPLTPAGKIDRARLPPPAPEAAVPETDYTAPRDVLAPTVRGLAEHLRSSIPLDGCVSLVAITRSSVRTPVFAVGGVGGSATGFVDLARALGPEQGFYALQSAGLDGLREPLESIEAMAELYVSEIRSVQPRGPYALIGASFGAAVALEMARRLAESGEEVALLGLLDPIRHDGEEAGTPAERRPRVLKRAGATVRLVVSRLQLYRRELRELGLRERFVYVGGKLRTLLRRASGRTSLEGVRLEMNLTKVHRANTNALHRFERKPLAGGIRLLAIFQTPHRASRATDEWVAGSGGRVVRHDVTGDDSGDMLTGENAHVLAAALAMELQHAFEPQ